MSTPLYDPARVGGDTLSYCTRCKMELAHVIVSMLKDRPVKVLCKTCKTEHRYRSSAPAMSVAAILAGPKKAPKVALRVAEVWEKKMSETKGKASRPYNVKESYKQGEVIDHSKFGLGFIEEVRVGKISVLFKDESRTLIHEMGR